MGTLKGFPMPPALWGRWQSPPTPLRLIVLVKTDDTMRKILPRADASKSQAISVG